MTAAATERPLPGTAVLAAVIAGALVGAATGAMIIAAGDVDPSYSSPDTRSAGLVTVGAMFGAGPGGFAGLLVGVVVWKLDHLLVRRFSFIGRSVIEGVLIAAFTIISTSLVLWDWPAGTIGLVTLAGTLFAAALSAAYFAWCYRRYRKS